MNKFLNFLIRMLCRHCSYLYSDTFYCACDAMARDKYNIYDKSRYPRAYATAWTLDHGISLD